MQTDEPRVHGQPMNGKPSLRRVLTGYLRLRSPYNLCVDALLIVALSYVLSAGEEWVQRVMWEEQAAQPTTLPRAWWFVMKLTSIVTGVVYLAGLGIFFVACARIIADRIGERSPVSGNLAPPEPKS
jgi:TRAP-type C4-dicarboxylate transport system permease small subunit